MTSSLLIYFICLWIACIWLACWDHCFTKVRRLGQEKSLWNLKLAALPLSFMHKHSEFSPSLPGYFKNYYNYLPAFFHICICSAFLFLQNVWILTGKRIQERKRRKDKCVLCFLIHRWAAQLWFDLSYISVQGSARQWSIWQELTSGKNKKHFKWER